MRKYMWYTTVSGSKESCFVESFTEFCEVQSSGGVIAVYASRDSDLEHYVNTAHVVSWGLYRWVGNVEQIDKSE